MGLGTLIGILIVGAIAGWLAAKLVKGRGFGLLGNIVVGILGALLAGWLLPRLGFSAGTGALGGILRATFGAVVLLVAVKLVKQV
jgi:uncharacterized membrane protein YeaQ/YmgE (transglycosylase-associated protein family)